MELNNQTPESLLYEIALSRIEGVGNILYKNLITYFGSAAEVFNSSNSKLAKIQGVGPQLVKAFSTKKEALEEAEKIISDSEKYGVRILYQRSGHYPKSLKEIYDSPAIIYVKGNGSFQSEKTISIVGSRDATAYGKEVTDSLVKNLKDVQIISGLAYGIDIAAHRAALKYNLSTIAVLANGLDSVYPASHKKVAEEILETGLLVSEQPIYTKLHPTYFVSRNRIIAALSQITLIVESKKRGGSMITAEYANNYHRDVFAVPGNVEQKLSEGTNHLIFTNKANIYTGPKELIDWMNWQNQKRKVKKEPVIDWSNFSENEIKVLKLLSDRGEMLIDDLSWYSEIPPNKLSSLLLGLEFKDIIKQVPGKKFSLKA